MGGGGGTSSNPPESKREYSSIERDDIADYQTMGYAALNAFLRGEIDVNPKYYEYKAEVISGAMTPTDQDQILYRCLGQDGEEDFINAGQGGIVQDKGFVSTSKEESVVYKRSPMFYVKAVGEHQYHQEPRFWIADIKTPAGARAIDMNTVKTGNTALSFEQEILLDKGGSFRVDKVDYDNKRLSLTRIV